MKFVVLLLIALAASVLARRRVLGRNPYVAPVPVYNEPAPAPVPIGLPTNINWKTDVLTEVCSVSTDVMCVWRAGMLSYPGQCDTPYPYYFRECLVNKMRTYRDTYRLPIFQGI
jgi:hypothetical protein